MAETIKAQEKYATQAAASLGLDLTK